MYSSLYIYLNIVFIFVKKIQINKKKQIKQNTQVMIRCIVGNAKNVSEVNEYELSLESNIKLNLVRLPHSKQLTITVRKGVSKQYVAKDDPCYEKELFEISNYTMIIVNVCISFYFGITNISHSHI